MVKKPIILHVQMRIGALGSQGTRRCSDLHQCVFRHHGLLEDQLSILSSHKVESQLIVIGAVNRPLLGT
jgi:hypothetical protein